MSLLLSAQSVTKAFGSRPIFENISLAIHEGDRLGLIGPNGAGKSTFLKILAGLLEPDEGEVSRRRGVRYAYVSQQPEFVAEQSVEAILQSAIADERLEEGERAARVSVAMGRVGFDQGSALAGTLSGGWRKRLAVARELVKQPDLLLLDEPTNHLDLEGIEWLEEFLQNAPFSCVVVSHDRYFLDGVANRMAEIDKLYPEGLLRIEGNYSEFLSRKDEFLVAQSRHAEALENQVRRELEWLRRRPKARTSKSKARIDMAGQLMEELADWQQRQGRGAAQIDFTATDRKTKRLVSVEGVSKSLGGRTLFENVKFALLPGVRMGLVGANGTGKSTLLKLVKRELEPDQGTIECAQNLRVVTFDQYREPLNPNVTLRQALCPDGDSVIFQGRPLHVVAWAKRFLFRSDQLELMVGRLSGGEQARVFLANLMLQPADLLLLDEPTNDLDISTLDVLEDNLLEFPGAIMLVTHDRFLLDRVSTVVLGLDGEGHGELFADYRQWEAALAERRATRAARPPERAIAAVEKPAGGRRKLSYTEQREWDQMETRILDAEQLLAVALNAQAEASSRADVARLQQAYTAVQTAQETVDTLYARWAELEAKLA